MYMNRNLIIFLASAIPFSIFVGIYSSYEYGIPAGIARGLFAGLIFGCFMNAILGSLHRRAVRKITDDNSYGTLRVHHVRDVRTLLTYDRAFDLCIESLGSIKRCKVIEQDRAAGTITAKAGINWKTWSDTISFSVSRSNYDYTSITISSRPTARTTLVDFGKNLENAIKIVSFLEKNK